MLKHEVDQHQSTLERLVDRREPDGSGDVVRIYAEKRNGVLVITEVARL